MKIKAIITFCFLIWLLSFQHTAKIENIKKFPGLNSSIPIMHAEAVEGSEEDPDARIEYEWLRTRNPNTNQIPENIRQKELAFSRSIPTMNQLSPNQNMGGFQGSFNGIGAALTMLVVALELWL